MILETERLMLREMTQSDFDDLAEMLCDPEVMYAYERDFSEEDVGQWLDNQLSRYKKYGFGMWSVILKQSGNMIGQAGITMQPYKDGELHEIGYLFKKAFWHNGYATEAARALKNYAFRTLQRDDIFSTSSFHTSIGYIVIHFSKPLLITTLLPNSLRYSNGITNLFFSSKLYLYCPINIAIPTFHHFFTQNDTW